MTPDELRYGPESRGLPLIDLVELPMAKGRRVLDDHSAVASVFERICALRVATNSSDGRDR